MSDLVQLAKRICIEAHQGQIDKAGEQYSTHPIRVATHASNLARVFFPKLQVQEVEAIALLHDVIEDCPEWSASRLVECGIPEALIPFIEAVTKQPEESRSDYLVRIQNSGTVPIIVKIADLTDNTDPLRVRKLPKELADRLAGKYDSDLMTVGQAFARAILAG